MWRQNGADNLIRTAKEKKKKRIFRNEKSLKDNIKHTSICITEFPEDKREKGAETFFEKIMVWSHGVSLYYATILNPNQPLLKKHHYFLPAPVLILDKQLI